MIAREKSSQPSAESAAEKLRRRLLDFIHRQHAADDAGRGDEEFAFVRAGGLLGGAGHRDGVLEPLACRCRRWRCRR